MEIRREPSPDWAGRAARESISSCARPLAKGKKARQTAINRAVKVTGTLLARYFQPPRRMTSRQVQLLILSTSSIGFRKVDSIGIFAGIRKNDASAQVLPVNASFAVSLNARLCRGAAFKVGISPTAQCDKIRSFILFRTSDRSFRISDGVGSSFASQRALRSIPTCLPAPTFGEKRQIFQPVRKQRLK